MGFTILQNIYSEKAKQLEINNFPGVDFDKDPCLKYEYIIENLNLLHWFCIKPILEAFGQNGIMINSAYRSMELNQALGGNPKSGHIRGNSIDIRSRDYPNSTLWNWCFNNLPEYDQLIWEYPEKGDFASIYGGMTSWIHISYIDGNNSKKSSMSSDREDLHEMYEGEKTLRIGNYTHNITMAEQRLV